MNETTLWASGTAVVVAFFTTVVAQYVFAPTLEARKQRILDRSRIASEIADQLRAMRARLIEERTDRYSRIADIFGDTPDGPSFHDMVIKFDVMAAIGNAGLKTEYESLVMHAIPAADLYCYQVPVDSNDFAPIVKLFEHTINALDPVNPPWVRASHGRRGMKLCSALEARQQEELDAPR